MSDEQGGIQDEMFRTLKANSEDPERGRAFKEDITRRHREAGKSMFGMDPAYPGQLVEIAPDGRWFITDKDRNRLHEIDPLD